MDIQELKNRRDWLKVWSGKWSFHSCSQFGEMWSIRPSLSGKPAYPRVVYIHRQLSSDCWVSRADRDIFCGYLIGEIKKDKNKPIFLANALKSDADDALGFMKKYAAKKIDLAIYDNFWEQITVYYLSHIYIKYIVDYLDPEQLDKYLAVLEEARVYAEPVFHDQEIFMTKIAEQIAEFTALSPELILCTTKDELRAYLQNRPLPNKELLQNRFILAAQFFNLGDHWNFVGEEAEKIENIITPNSFSDVIKGQVAYPGKVSGRARIINDPLHYQGEFSTGDILVTGMTRPEYLPFMKKSGAFVTDAGGILSHAAITARELKKPCIIGTQVATKILKSGDLITVDADAGEIRIIK